MGLLKNSTMDGKPEGWYPEGDRRERYWTGTRWDARRQLLRNGEVVETEDWYTDSAGQYHRVYPPLEEELVRKREEEQRATATTKEARDEHAYWQSPIGRARQAFSDGDHYFQLELPHSQVKGMVAAMVGVSTQIKHSAGGTDTLGAVVAEGWRLVSSGWVYVQTGQESRDKFLASGQQIVTRGEVVGIYLFERLPANRPSTP